MKDNKKTIIILVVLFIAAVSYYSSRNSPLQNGEKNNQLPAGYNNNPDTSLKTNNTIKGSAGIYYNKIITQAQAEALVKKNWGDCPKIGCQSYVVSVKTGNVVTAIYNLQNTSGPFNRIQKQAVATYSSGVWKLGTTFTQQECSGGTKHADGSAGMSPSPCI